MDIFDALHTRRSIRVFTPGPLPEGSLRILLGAAMTAPSAGNAQPWRFVVVEDRTLLHKAADIHPYAAMSRNAALAILVCGDLTREKYPGYWVQDCAAATQNLLLAAHGLGLGAVWCGVHPDAGRSQAFQALVGLPASVLPLSWVPIGLPGQQAVHKDRYDASLVSRNIYGGPI